MNNVLSVCLSLCICAASTAFAEQPALPHKGGLTPPLTVAQLRRAAEEHMKEARRDFPEWQDARLSETPYPFYRPDIKGAAYYEFAVISGQNDAPTGFIILSTGHHDHPVVQWSTTGKSNAFQLAEESAKLGKKPDRYYLLDVLSFAVEDKQGKLIAQLGELRIRAQDWSGYKRRYAAAYKDKINELRKEAVSNWATVGADFKSAWCGDWSTYWAGTDTDQRMYEQIPGGTPPNSTDCWSGCGPTAWAMLIGWADYRASQNDPVWRNSWGLFGCVDEAAPQMMDCRVMDMIWEIRGDVKTECNITTNGQGRTWPWNMDKVKEYLKRRTNSSPGVDVSFNQLGFPTDSLRDKADSIIHAGRPVVIQLGWEHYPLAFGYRKKACAWGRDKHEFRINDGNRSTRWTSASTSFVGDLLPYQQVAPLPNPCPEGQRCCCYTPKGYCVSCVAANQECPGCPYSGCKNGEQCCEPGDEKTGCRLCWPRNAQCP